MKSKLWKALSLATIFLLVVSVVGGNVASTYEAMLNDVLRIETSKVIGGESPSGYYTSNYADLQEMIQAKVQLLRDIADEGVVLLKNDGALPISGGKVTVFGEDNFIMATNNGGGSVTQTMSGMSTRLSDALGADGLTITDSGCDMALVVIGRVAGEGTDAPADSLALTAQDRANLDAAKTTGGKVVVLLSGDHPIEAAELKADSGISAILRFGNAGFRGAYGVADVITGQTNPSGKLVETFAADTASAPANMNFGNYTYTNGSKIKASQAKNYVVYAEGIYTDYRYYETRYEDSVLGQGNSGDWSYDNEVVWPFGFGLSYTSFSKALAGVEFDDSGHTAAVTVTVTNTGPVAGKEVVQVYAQSPYTDYDRENQVEKSAVQLMGFEKTRLLEPGESETVTVTINLQWLASYDYTEAKGYILDAGDYYFSIGNGAHEAVNNVLAAKGAAVEGNAELTHHWIVDAFDAETYRNSIYTGAAVTNAFPEADLNNWKAGTITYLSRSDWQGTYPKTIELEATPDMVSTLNDTKRYQNGEWSDTRARAEAQEVSYMDLTTLDAVNKSLSSVGVENVTSLRGKPYDDEGWTEILDRLSIYEMSRMVAQGRWLIQAMPSVTFPESTGSDSPIGLNIPYVTLSVDSVSGAKTPIPAGYTVTDGITDDAIPVNGELEANMYASEPVLGATFNKELARRQGDLWGEDGLYCNASFTWAPGANLHRSAYGGRASEYLSSDPVHTSLMVGEITKAANERGQVLTVKHFVINEQEQNRIGVATFTNEQALRELYLRAFEGIMTYGEARGMMSSYNRIGVISTSAEYDLLTTVLRDEWGSNAYVITDLGSPTAGLYDGNAAIAAGVSTMMNNGVYDDASKAYVNQTLTIDNIKADPVLLYATREACHRILFNFIHSNAVNGISSDAQIVLITPWWKTAFTAMWIVFGVSAVGTTALYLISANKKKEER